MPLLKSCFCSLPTAHLRGLKFAFSLIFAALSICLPTGLRCSADVNSAVQPITVTDSTGLWAKSPDGMLKVDFGQVNSADQGAAVDTFIIQNTSDKPVVVASVTTSCGCTTTTLNSSGGGTSTPLTPETAVTIAAGGQVRVTAAIDTARLMPGPFDKFVWITLQGSVKPAATIELTGSIERLAAFTPDRLNFGSSTLTGFAPKWVAVVVDPESLANIDTTKLMLVSKSSDFIVTERKTVRTGENIGARELVFEVSVSRDSEWGAISTSLYFLPTGNKLVDNALRLETVPVSATALGPVVASPAVISFSTANSTDGAYKTVTLTSNSPGILADLIVSSGDSDIIPIISRSDRPSGTQTQTQIVVNLMRGARLGPIDTAITITFSKKSSVGSVASKSVSGKLIIPVSGYVSSATPPI